MKILQLPPEIANQIAAGEVIERPASVVKELLENALDAGAKAIQVEIECGGLNRIKISDDGLGIEAGDLPLAIAAHATSKIKNLHDLYSITSMGFRGEALASIASISKLSIRSKPAMQEHAMVLTCADGFTNLNPCARSNGTTVDVQELFYNTPVRKKFLKSDQTEYQAIEAVVKRFAMCKPATALSLSHNGKSMLNLPIAACEETKRLRIKKLFGKSFLEQAAYIDCERGGMRLEGWISGPDFHRSQNDKQWVYINQRMVKDKLLNHALRKGYENILPPGRFPVILLFLTIPPEEVDVNVHPTKHEVRFQQPRLVHDLLVSQITTGLAAFKNIFSDSPESSISYPYSFNVGESQATAHLIAKEPQQTYSPMANSMPGSGYSHKRDELKSVNYPDITNNASFIPLNAEFALMFITSQPYLINVHHLIKAHTEKKLAECNYPLAKRPLLVPISYTIKISPQSFLSFYQSTLDELGVEVELIGEADVIIRSIPVLLPKLDLNRFFHTLNNKKTALQKDELLLLMIESQTIDARQLEEQAELGDFLKTRLLVSSFCLPWCIHLDIKTCKELLSSNGSGNRPGSN